MKRKLLLMGMLLILSSPCVFADTINGFDGFTWGSRRDDITRVRGEKSILWGDSEIWNAREGEKASGFSIRLVGYDFENGCTPLKEKTTKPCLLWGGFYVLETTSIADVDKLINLLNNKYGAYKSAHETLKKRSQRTNELLSNIEITTHIWEQVDKSSVELIYKSYDRDHIDEKESFEKGIFILGVKYYSSDYKIHEDLKDKEHRQLNEKSL